MAGNIVYSNLPLYEQFSVTSNESGTVRFYMGPPNSGGGPTPAASLMIYVNVAGNDVTGDGSEGLPFRTINRACTLVRSFGNASTTIRYAIIVGPGRYTEALIITPWTYIVGTSIEGTRVTFTSFGFGAEWTPAGDHRSGLQNMTVSGGVTVDFSSVSTNEGKLRFDDVVFNDRWNYVAFSAINQIVLKGCFFFDAWSQTGINLLALASSGGNGGAIVATASTVPALVNLIDSGFDGGLTLTATAQPATATLYGSSIGGQLTLDGALASIDPTSTPRLFPAGVNLLGGAVDPRWSVYGSHSATGTVASLVLAMGGTGFTKDRTTTRANSPSRIVFVDAGNAISTTQSGSLDDPFATIQAAVDYIDTAAWNSGAIMIAPGTYAAAITVPNNGSLNNIVFQGWLNCYQDEASPADLPDVSGAIVITNAVGTTIVTSFANLLISTSITSGATGANDLTVTFAQCFIAANILGGTVSVKCQDSSWSNNTVTGSTSLDVTFDGFSWSSTIIEGTTFTPADYGRAFTDTGANYLPTTFAATGLAIGNSITIPVVFAGARANDYAMASMNLPSADDFTVTFARADTDLL